jgi:hypothetical protein
MKSARPSGQRLCFIAVILASARALNTVARASPVAAVGAGSRFGNGSILIGAAARSTGFLNENKPHPTHPLSSSELEFSNTPKKDCAIYGGQEENTHSSLQLPSERAAAPKSRPGTLGYSVSAKVERATRADRSSERGEGQKSRTNGLPEYTIQLLPTKENHELECIPHLPHARSSALHPRSRSLEPPGLQDRSYIQWTRFHRASFLPLVQDQNNSSLTPALKRGPHRSQLDDTHTRNIVKARHHVNLCSSGQHANLCSSGRRKKLPDIKALTLNTTVTFANADDHTYPRGALRAASSESDGTAEQNWSLVVEKIDKGHFFPSRGAENSGGKSFLQRDSPHSLEVNTAEELPNFLDQPRKERVPVRNEKASKS